MSTLRVLVCRSIVLCLVLPSACKEPNKWDPTDVERKDGPTTTGGATAIGTGGTGGRSSPGGAGGSATAPVDAPMSSNGADALECGTGTHVCLGACVPNTSPDSCGTS